jgi:hypothetical protein
MVRNSLTQQHAKSIMYFNFISHQQQIKPNKP